jgi:beta-hydroxylase
MSALTIFTAILAIIGLIALTLWLRIRMMTSKQKKALVKKTLNGVFAWSEDRGWLPRTPAFDHDYLSTYPELKIFEEHYEDIREECLNLLGAREELVEMSAMGGAYTQAGIHTIDWKTVMFKAGDMVEENCRLCPKTAALLRQSPTVFTAFFSVLEPNQYITPHWGYYKGFVRYHLGVQIPDNNDKQLCWLRVNGNAEDNAQRNPELIERGEVYYWKNGEGIVFDDNYLHDAANSSDQQRTVMWLDVRRKMPFLLDLYNRLCLALMRRDESIRKIQRNAVIPPQRGAS